MKENHPPPYGYLHYVSGFVEENSEAPRNFLTESISMLF